jgi:tripartite-type tricarboxylate transporter receptor subunit TctC
MRAFPIALGVALAAAQSLALAQSWPARPVKVISTFSAGSPADGLMRLVAQKMGDSIGQPVVVEVLSGAGGVLGAQQVARAAPDGYTLLNAISTTLVTTPHLLKNRNVDLKDFTPVIVMAKAATCMLGAASFPPNNALEMFEYAKQHPGEVAYGSNGIGGTYHLEMETLKASRHVQITHVPYKGGTNALMAAVSGSIPVAFAPCASVASQVKAGKVKFLAQLDYKRSSDYPDVPAMAELMPEYQKISGGVDIWAPAGIPAPLVGRIRDEIDKALALPDVRARMKEISFPYDGTALEEMGALRQKDYELAARAVKIAGLKPE